MTYEEAEQSLCEGLESFLKERFSGMPLGKDGASTAAVVRALKEYLYEVYPPNIKVRRGEEPGTIIVTFGHEPIDPPLDT